MMLKLALWLIGGGVLRTIAIASIASLPAFGVGYMRGYQSADRSAHIAGLQTTIETLERYKRDRDAADALAAEQAVRDANTERENDATVRSVDDAIAAAPLVSNCVTGTFLERLRNLK